MDLAGVISTGKILLVFTLYIYPKEKEINKYMLISYNKAKVIIRNFIDFNLFLLWPVFFLIIYNKVDI